MKTITKNVTVQIKASEILTSLCESLADVVSDSDGELSFNHYAYLLDALALGKESTIRGAFKDGSANMLSNELYSKLEELDSQGIDADVEVKTNQGESILIRSEDICF